MVHFFGISISSSLLGWIGIGLLAGWLAGVLSRGSGFGCVANIFVGLIGSVLGGWIFSRLGYPRQRLHLQPRSSNGRRRVAVGFRSSYRRLSPPLAAPWRQQ